MKKIIGLISDLWTRGAVLLSMILVFGIVSVYAQEGVATTEDVTNAVTALTNAISEKGGVLIIISLALSALLEVFKHKHLGAIVYKIPFLNNPRVRFFLFPVTGALIGMFQKLDEGSAVSSAILGAIMITLPAVTGHQAYKAIRPASAKPSNPEK